MSALVTNNAWGKLSVSISDTDKQIVLSGGQGSRFPLAVAGSSWFYATLIDSSNNLEIIKCTARVGDTLTVVRGQDGTTARAYANGSRIELRPCAALLNEKLSTDTYNTQHTALAARVTSAERAIASITVEGTPMSTAGGDMTGPLKFVIEEGSTTRGEIGLDSAKNIYEIVWMYGSKAGAGMMLNRSTSASNPNAFILQAKDPNGTAKQLIGKTDGSLTWGGNFTASGTITATNGFSTSKNISASGTLTVGSAVNFANNTWNKLGDDAYFGDHNVGGCMCVKAQSGAPGIAFFNSGDSQLGKLTVSSGSFVSTIPIKATTFQATSDQRLKSDMTHVSGSPLLGIRAYRYTFKPDGKRHIGLIAQELEKYYPEAVGEDDQGYKSIDYNAVCAIMLNTIHDLVHRIEKLERAARN